MRLFSHIVWCALFITGVIFAFLNHGQVIFNYYFATKQISLSLLLVFSLGIGILLGFAVTAIYCLRIKAEKTILKSRLKQVEKELSNLRSLPVHDICHL